MALDGMSGIQPDGAKADAINHQIAGEERLYGRFTILRRGKKKYGLVSWL